MDADFQPTLLMEKTKVGTLLVSAQILWGKGVSPCLNSWQMHILFGTSVWSGPTWSGETKKSMAKAGPGLQVRGQQALGQSLIDSI